MMFVCLFVCTEGCRKPIGRYGSQLPCKFSHRIRGRFMIFLGEGTTLMKPLSLYYYLNPISTIFFFYPLSVLTSTSPPPPIQYYSGGGGRGVLLPNFCIQSTGHIYSAGGVHTIPAKKTQHFSDTFRIG